MNRPARREQGKSRKNGRWTFPHPLALEEPYLGYQVVVEAPDDIAVYLWQLLRSALLCAELGPQALAPDAARNLHGLRAAARGDVLPPREAEEAVFSILSGQPALPVVSDGLLRLSAWLEESGSLRAACSFAYAAALVDQDNAIAAYKVGRLARRLALYEQADVWFRRSLGLARRTTDHAATAWALLGMGNLNIERGNWPRARHYLLRCMRAVRRHGVLHVRPLVLHDLFTVAAQLGRHDEAAALAKRAFRAYGNFPVPGQVRLAADCAHYWLLQGHAERALPVFKAVLPHLTRRSDKLLVWSSVARASAEVKERMSFVDAWAEVWRLIERSKDEEAVAAAAVYLAQGAAALGDRTRATIAAKFAREVAERRREAEMLYEAEMILLSVPTPPATQQPLSEEPATRETADDLANNLLTCLSAGGLTR